MRFLPQDACFIVVAGPLLGVSGLRAGGVGGFVICYQRKAENSMFGGCSETYPNPQTGDCAEVQGYVHPM